MNSEQIDTVAGPDGSGHSAVLGGEVSIRLDLGYDGTDFHGWAKQPGLRTACGVLQAALEQVLRLPTDTMELTVAGRTDAGVHTTGQVAQVQVPVSAWQSLPGRSDNPPELALVRRLAGVLPPDLRVHRVGIAPEGFDARFSAIWRRYAYRLCDDPAGLPPLRRRDVLLVKPTGLRLDLDAMNQAAAGLIGLHDFAAFCKRREGATTIRTLQEYSFSRDENDLVVAHLKADAFCHSMVRALIGTLLPVGQGRKPVSWPTEILAARERSSHVSVVGPSGLTLEEVGYPPDDQLAARAIEARRTRPESDLGNITEFPHEFVAEG